MKQLNDIDKQIEDDNKSNFTFDLDIEKQVDSLLYDEDDDLNDAKYLENDKSNWSSTSNIFSSNLCNNKNQHNMTTPMPLANNILQNQIFTTMESEDKFSNINTNITSENSATELNKKNLGEKNKINNNNNKNNENKELNISILGDKFQDTLTGDSNNNINNNTNNNTGKIIGSKNNNIQFNPSKKLCEKMINMTQSNTSSFDFHSNSVDFNNINLIKELYYCQTPNNSIYYNQYYLNKNNSRYNKFQQNYSQSLYLQDYYKNGKILNNEYFNKRKNFNDINSINFSELNTRNSIQSVNINNNRFIYNNFNNLTNNYINLNNIKTKINEDINKNYKDNYKLMFKEQKGAKYIQKKIEEKNPDFLFKLYEQIKNNLYDIMTNQYGNYVIQKFVENCDKKLLSNMLKNLSINNGKILYEISINNYGTRPLQKLIENLSNNMTQQDINIILNFAKGNTLNLIKDINGNRIIQSIIQNIKNKELLSPIYKEINENITEIIKTKSGCCVFAKIIINIIEEDLNSMTDIIINNIENLINDEFGNISLKRLIKLNNENFNNKIYNYIKDNLMQLSCQKFSSNVIDACVDNNTSLKKKVIKKLIENENNITDLILDQYGNYIIQNALQNSEKNEFYIIIQHIKENEKKLKQTNHGKIVFEKLMKNYKNFLVDNKIKQEISNCNSIKNKKQDYRNNIGKKNKNKYNVNKKNKK